MNYRFKFYFKDDPKKEAIGHVTAKNFLEAELLASQIKKLSVHEFLKIFAVTLA